MSKTRTVYILKHHAVDSYVKDPRTGKLTDDIQQAYRCDTEAEAAGMRKVVKVQLAWDPVSVTYDLSTGRVVT
jgi:hypothetical protein